MSDERRDDEIVGRALSRAIETIDVNETPYEQSRIAIAPAARGTLTFPRLVAAVAAILFALAFGAWFVRPSANEQVAGSPSPAPIGSVTATPSPPATAGVATGLDHQVVYFYRFDLPPVAQHVDGIATQPTAEERIRSRLDALNNVRSGVSPKGGAGNAFPLQDPTLLKVNTVKVEGELARVDFNVPSSGWGYVEASTPDQLATGLRQQLVYTGTEEPGVRAVLFTQNGGQRMRISSYVFDQPLTRENVFGYERVDPRFTSEGWALSCDRTPCPSPSTARLSHSFSVDTFAPGVTRFVVQVDSGQPSDVSIAPITIDEAKSPLSGKYVLRIDIAGTEARQGLEVVERTPLRSIRSRAQSGRTTYELGLDDLRPWRVLTLADPQRLVIDLGGYPQSISSSIAVYTPGQGYPPFHQFRVSGLSRVFEASTLWRIVDSNRRVVASGATTASLGTSQQWGTFEFDVQLASPVNGDLWLEVYSASPKDGTELGLVRVHLKVG